MNTKRERKLAINLYRLRTANRQSASELDGVFNLSPGTWSRYEAGEEPPRDVTLRIRDYYGVDIFDLLYKEVRTK